MSLMADKDTYRIKDGNISYYNEIAGDYDRVLLGDDSNRLIRQKVKDVLQILYW